MARPDRWFTPGDLDGFFGLFFSGFPDLLLIVGLAPICGFPLSFVAGRILPAVAFSILAGNVFYAWQARRLARREGRTDVTAIPFGVNTPTIFAYFFLIMGPIYTRTHDANLAWHAGVFASMVSGLVQTAGAFCTDWLRRNTPRAALLAPLAGLALAYLCLGFIFGVFQQPAIALLPMLVLLTLYGSHLKLPWRMPPALLVIALGAVLVAVLRWLHIYNVPPPVVPALQLYLPHVFNIFPLFTHRAYWSYLAIILPLAALDTLASLMILESVKLSGDDYATRPSLLMNGLGTLGAACLGSPFPTTLYLGHAAHKANGARSGYSLLNGVVTLLLCTTGILPVVLRFVPLEVAAPVVIWFGLITIGQAVVDVPPNQAIAVVIGLIPALAQWATSIADVVARKAGSSLMAVAPRMGSDLAMGGLIALGQGSLLTSMVWSAMMALIVQRRFQAAAAWTAVAAVLSAVGIIHAYTLSPNGVESQIGWWVSPSFTLAYAGGAAFLLLCAWYARQLDLFPAPQTNLSSRPERSAVEGPAVRPGTDANLN
jgi:AGZA family xanthine/uracil permease-like MFS transporter